MQHSILVTETPTFSPSGTTTPRLLRMTRDALGTGRSTHRYVGEPLSNSLVDYAGEDAGLKVHETSLMRIRDLRIGDCSSPGKNIEEKRSRESMGE